MPSSQSDWDAKYRLASEAPASEPASIVRELLPLLPKGPALDIACGTGRNTLLVAARGQHVTAIDWSGVALNTLAERARAAGTPVRKVGNAGRASLAGVDLVHEDMERAEIPEGHYDLIMCIQYLQRTLFPRIACALRPGGVLLVETYTRAQLDFGGGPQNPAYLLETGELREAFPELCVLFYRELRAGQGIASLLARK